MVSYKTLYQEMKFQTVEGDFIKYWGKNCTPCKVRIGESSQWPKVEYSPDGSDFFEFA